MVILELQDINQINKMKMEDGIQIESSIQNLMMNKKMTIDKKKILNYIINKKV